MKIPEWQYPLYKDSDRKAYLFLKSLARRKVPTVFLGSDSQISSFLKFLILSQKLKDYRKSRDIILPYFKGPIVDLEKLLEEASRIRIPRGIDTSWAIFTQDKRLCELIDRFMDEKIGFVGKNCEAVEFVARFLLSQLLQDWRGPKMAVVLSCIKDKKVKLSKLNKLLNNWDYTGIFKNKPKTILDGFGIAKGLAPFKRDHDDREF